MKRKIALISVTPILILVLLFSNSKQDGAWFEKIRSFKENFNSSEKTYANGTYISIAQLQIPITFRGKWAREYQFCNEKPNKDNITIGNGPLPIKQAMFSAKKATLDGRSLSFDGKIKGRLFNQNKTISFIMSEDGKSLYGSDAIERLHCPAV